MPQIAAVCLVGGVRDDGGIGTQANSGSGGVAEWRWRWVSGGKVADKPAEYAVDVEELIRFIDAPRQVEILDHYLAFLLGPQHSGLGLALLTGTPRPIVEQHMRGFWYVESGARHAFYCLLTPSARFRRMGPQ